MLGGGTRARRRRRKLKNQEELLLRGNSKKKTVAVKSDVPVVCVNKQFCDLCGANKLLLFQNPRCFSDWGDP